MFALLGTAAPATMQGWFTALAQGGTIIDPLQRRPWATVTAGSPTGSV
ncbi:hypothetical protein [Microbacterium protaetiae]|nr:hypothetical protein [Microbacterium protaetiae]